MKKGTVGILLCIGGRQEVENSCKKSKKVSFTAYVSIGEKVAGAGCPFQFDHVYMTVCIRWQTGGRKNNSETKVAVCVSLPPLPAEAGGKDI